MPGLSNSSNIPTIYNILAKFACLIMWMARILKIKWSKYALDNGNSEVSTSEIAQFYSENDAKPYNECADVATDLLVINNYK